MNKTKKNRKCGRKGWMAIVLIPMLMLVGFTSAKYLLGDINGDGNVNGKDLTRLLKYLSKESQNVVEGNLDANGDGKVDEGDLSHMMDYLSGADVTLSGSGEIRTEGDNGSVTCSSFVYGMSEMGKELICYQIAGDTYDRTVLLNFAIHGYEDEYAADGQVLVDAANAMIEHYAKSTDMKNCRLLIIPCANPDGLYDGNTNNGFGRCNAKGIDLNRDFDANYVSYSTARYYTPYAFSAAESRALRDLCLEHHPDVVIDFHGWLDETIGDSELAELFYQELGLTHYVGFTNSNCSGYFANWAHQNGALALLVEFTSSRSVNRDKLISAIDRLIAGEYDGGTSAEYELHETYGQFTDIQVYALYDGRVQTYAGFNIPFSTTSYIDGTVDLCTIRSIYANGWVKVSYPISGGTKTAYCLWSDFLKAEYLVQPYVAYTKTSTKVYAKSDMATSMGTVWNTDRIYVFAEDGTRAQIVYPLDSGGWKMGWILMSDISK